MKKTILLGLSVAMISACSTQQPATYNYYGVQKGAGSKGIHTVLPGDTLYSISKNYQIPMREIIVLNKLKPPYVVNAGYRMQLPPPNEYQAREGDTVQSVARMYEVSPNRLANLNGLQAPYHLTGGQVLRLPTPSGSNNYASRYNAPQNLKAVSQSPAQPQYAPARVANVERAPATTQPSSSSSAPWRVPVESKTLNAPATPAPVTPPVVAQKVPVPDVKPAAPAPKVKTSSVTRPKTPDVPKLAQGNFMRPVDGKVISSYGAKKDGLHNDGINIKAVKGTPVRAAQNGVVVYHGDDLEGYGNLVLIRHENKMMTAYAHLDKTLIKRGAKVARGQSIGTVGKTGQVDTPQLHFEVRKGSTPLNPNKYL